MRLMEKCVWDNRPLTFDTPLNDVGQYKCSESEATEMRLNWTTLYDLLAPSISSQLSMSPSVSQWLNLTHYTVSWFLKSFEE